MISRPEILVDNYKEQYARSKVVASYDIDNDTELVFDENGVDWNKATWYFSPTDDSDIKEIPQVKTDIDVCGMTHAFTSEAGVNAAYTQLRWQGTYIGM